MTNIHNLRVSQIVRKNNGLEATIFDDQAEARIFISSNKYAGELTLDAFTQWLQHDELTLQQAIAQLQLQHIFDQLDRFMPDSLDAILIKSLVREYGCTNAICGIKTATDNYLSLHHN